jgi:PPOX class probable F420-dependent enzyme
VKGRFVSLESSVKITEEIKNFISDRNFGFYACVLEDGSPVVTPVWVDYDGEFFLVNTTTDRVKYRVARKNAKVSLLIVDSGNPYRYLLIRGRLEEVTTDGAEEQINRMALKYTGRPKFTKSSPNEVRVLLKLRPEKVRNRL